MLNYIFACLLFLPFATFSQLNGAVQDKETKSPLAYASIYWQSNHEGVLTDEQGLFSIPLQRKDTLVIRYIGYAEKKLASHEIQKQSIIDLEKQAYIEEVVVTPVDPDEIMQLAIEHRDENHFVDDTKQQGFVRSFFFEQQTLFHISETAYNSYYYQKNDKSRQSVFATKSRSIIDSTKYKQINEHFQLKKDFLILEPIEFISIGQSVFDDEFTETNKWSYVYEYSGEIIWDDRPCYDISILGFFQGVPFYQARYLIDKDTYGFMATVSKTLNPEDLNKMLPLPIKTILLIAGYRFKLKDAQSKTYYRYNNGKFEVDKGVNTVAIDIKRKGEWAKFRLNQEFYLQSRISGKKPSESSNVEGEYSQYKNHEFVKEYTPDYFSKYFHLPTTNKTQQQIEIIQEKNATFTGEIYSSKYSKWLKKQEK